MTIYIIDNLKYENNAMALLCAGMVMAIKVIIPASTTASNG